MKLINNTLVLFSLVSLGLSSLEAKSLEFILDHQTKKTFHLQAEIPEQRQEQPFAQSSLLNYCQQLKIENLGNKPIRNFFPYVNRAPTLSLEDLAARLAEERYPLLSLYDLWNKSLIRDESLSEKNGHPLDLLNFKGACSQATFNQQFLKLCQALGFEIRLANVQGKEVYDFGLDDEWNFLDLNHHQLYLGLDNEKLASSEEVMDDPFLALRTKHSHRTQSFNFVENWKELAAFDILEPASAMPVVQITEELTKRSSGFDLFPGETLLFENSALRSELAPHECAIEHTVNLEARHVSYQWKYHSPFPLHRLTNKSTATIYLINQDIELRPGEHVDLEEEVFQVRLVFDSHPQGQISLSGICSWTLFPSLVKGKNQIHLGAKKNPSLVRFYYEVNEEMEKNESSAIQVCNQVHTFDYTSPFFNLEPTVNNVERIWWQIGLDHQFQLVPSNLDQVESFTSAVALSPISETFLSPGTTYYFRVKGYHNGKWSGWSTPYRFTVNKPNAVEEVLFDQIDENEYELNWERYAEKKSDSIEYLVYGSNSLDFIPSIYYDKQVNTIVSDQVVEEEINDNLIAITHDPKIRVNGGLAYYRIITRQKGQLSVPSKIIHVYDQDLIQPRNVLQAVKDYSRFIAKRMLFPVTYPGSEIALPRISTTHSRENTLTQLQSLLRTAKRIDKKITQHELPEVSQEIWAEVSPYLLPPNHPAWAKLNRVFCKTRATQSPEHFKKAGFRRWRPGRWSRVAASGHPEFPEYFIKAYCDTELGILYDWKRWIHRIRGAEKIRECIKQYHLQKDFKVPNKWIYPLPKSPSPPNSSRYLRKNFILVCENMRIEDHDTNEKMYKDKMTTKLMDGLYTILQVCGLYDSVYVFNIPFCKDGRMAVIDTEYWHKWPVPYQKLTSKFSKKLQSHWKRITYKGGKIPDGISQPTVPRMDRRDVKR